MNSQQKHSFSWVIIFVFFFVKVGMCSDLDLLPLVAPPAPFLRNDNKKSKISVPQIVKNSIVCGNKSLQFDPDGKMQLYASGRVVASSITFLIREIDKEINRKSWFGVNDKSKVNPSKINFHSKGNSFTWEMVIPYGEHAGNYKQEVTLLENGMISFDISYDFPDIDPKIKLEPASLLFKIPQQLSQGQNLSVNGKEYTIPAKPGFDFLSLDEPVAKVDFFTACSELSFSIVPQECKTINFYWDKYSKTDYIFRIWQNSSKKKLKFMLDLRNGIEVNTSSQTYAGIDFNAVEDLTLPDRSASKNLLVNPSFEQGFYGFRRDWPMLKFVNSSFWEMEPYSIDANEKHTGKQSLKMDAPQRVKGDYRKIGYPIRSFPVPLDAGTYTFSFYAKGSVKNQRVGVWFPNSCWVGIGNKHLPIGYAPEDTLKSAKKVFSISTDWQRYTMTLKVPQSMPVFVSIGADSPNSNSPVWLDDFQLEHSPVPTAFDMPIISGSFQTSREDNFLQPSDNFDARLVLYGKEEISGKATVEVSNFFKEEVFKGTYDFACKKDKTTTISLPINGSLGKGIFVIKVTYEIKGQEPHYEFHRYAVMDYLDNTHRLKNIFSEDYGGHMLGRFDLYKLLERYKRIGIGATCHFYLWNRSSEFSAIFDRYGIDIFDSSMGSIIRYFNGGDYFTGTQVNALVINSNPGIDNDIKSKDILLRDFHHDGIGEINDEYLKQLSAITARVVKEHPEIKLWALCGEFFHKWPIKWWAKDETHKTAFNNYAKLLVAFYEGVKKGNPEALVYQGAPTNMNIDGGIKEIDNTLAEINTITDKKFDIIGCHTYRKRPENPDLDSDIQALYEVLAKHGYNTTPVFFPEGMHYGPYEIPQWGIESASWLPPSCWYYGPLSYDMGWGEKISAAFRARSWLVALKHQNRVKTFMSGAFINNFEMDINLTPFATQKISNTLGRLLGDAEYKETICFAPYTRCYVFEDAQKRPVATIWGYHPKLDAGVMQPAMAKAKLLDSLNEVFDLMECRRSFEADTSGFVTFPIGSFPLFLRGKPGSTTSFIEALKNTAILSGSDIKPIIISAIPNSPGQLKLEIMNFLSRKIEASIEYSNRVIPTIVEGTKTTALNVPLDKPMSYDKINIVRTPIIIRSGDTRYPGLINFSAFLCNKTTDNIKIDGDLSDWQSIPEIKLENWVSNVKYAHSAPEHDFSGTFKVAWSEQGLYVGVRVKDSSFCVQDFEDPEKRWNNDSLQIYFDAFCDARKRQTTGYDENDYDYTIYPLSDGTATEVFRRRTPDPQLGLATNAPRDMTIASDIPSGFKRIKDGYQYEVFFPAKYLLPITLEKGYAVGLGIMINDLDKGDKNVKKALTIIPDGSGCFNKPHLWPSMLFWEREGESFDGNVHQE